jgi:hypothetical protein
VRRTTWSRELGIDAQALGDLTSPLLASERCAALNCPPQRMQFGVGLWLIDVFDPISRTRYRPFVQKSVSAEIATSPKT